MTDELPFVLATLEQAEEILQGLASLILGPTSAYSSTWECVDRVCDRFDIPQAA
jgi:hypothetical protein